MLWQIVFIFLNFQQLKIKFLALYIRCMPLNGANLNKTFYILCSNPFSSFKLPKRKRIIYISAAFFPKLKLHEHSCIFPYYFFCDRFLSVGIIKLDEIAQETESAVIKICGNVKLETGLSQLGRKSKFERTLISRHKCFVLLVKAERGYCLLWCCVQSNWFYIKSKFGFHPEFY